MRPGARLLAAIEIVDQILAATDAAAGPGPAADNILHRYFTSRRYAGSSDRKAIRDLVYRGLRFAADRPPSGRALFLGLAAEDAALGPLFDGGPHAPAPPQDDEPRAAKSLYPAWLAAELRARFGAGLDRAMQAMNERAPLDLRVNSSWLWKTGGKVADIASTLGASAIPGLPYGLRLAEPVPLAQHPLFLAGAFEIQDAGSQRVAALCNARPGETAIDLCAGGGGKTLALAAAMMAEAGAKQDERGRGHPEGHLVACDSDRRRLRAIEPRLRRAGVAPFVEGRLLDPGREGQALADLEGRADLVLVDAPCSGSGTWRRSPELRWRLSPRELERLCALQQRLLAIGARLLKKDGRLVYAVCSLLPAEGAQQIARAEATLPLRATKTLFLSPDADGCDGFSIAHFVRNC